MSKQIILIVGSAAVAWSSCAALAQTPSASQRFAACLDQGAEQRVIEVCEAADDLERQRAVWGDGSHPADHARVEAALGAAYFVLGDAGDDVEAYRAAAASYRAASSHYDTRDTRARWAGMQLSLGGVLVALAELGDADALEQSVPTLRGGVEALNRAHQPELWASLNTSLANAHVVRWRAIGDRDDLLAAVSALQASLEVYRRARFAERRAVVQQRLSEVLEMLGGAPTES